MTNEIIIQDSMFKELQTLKYDGNMRWKFNEVKLQTQSERL